MEAGGKGAEAGEEGDGSSEEPGADFFHYQQEQDDYDFQQQQQQQQDPLAIWEAGGRGLEWRKEVGLLGCC